MLLAKQYATNRIYGKTNALNFDTKRRHPAVGNPFVKWHTIPVVIKRYFTDVDGVILDKNTVPAALQVEYPFFVFGNFDMQGGYQTGLKTIGPIPGTFYLTSFVNAGGITSQQITGFSAFNEIKGKIATGDIIHVFTDDLDNPNYFIWIVLHNPTGPLSSITGNSQTEQRDGLIGKIYLEKFQYFSDNERQWDYPVHFYRVTNIANYGSEQVQPYIFKTPFTMQNGFIEMKCEFNFDQFLGLASYFRFETESITWNFRLADI